MKNIYISVFAVMLAGCSAGQVREPYSMQEGGLVIFATDQDQKMLFTKDVERNDSHRFCMTPQHDAAASYSSGIGISGGTPLIKEGISAGNSKGELALGGRSPSVLIARELMYRACELTSNHNADIKTTLEVYERFLQAIEKMTVTQTEGGSQPYSLAAKAINTNLMDGAEKEPAKEKHEDYSWDELEEDETPQDEDDNA